MRRPAPLLGACAGCVAVLVVAVALAVVLLREVKGLFEPIAETRGVLVVAIDDLPADALERPGAPASTLARLAEEGEARRLVTASTATNAAVASLLTGLPPAEHGVASVREIGRHRLPESVPTLAGELDEWYALGTVSLRQLEEELSGLARGFYEWVDAGVPRSGAPRRADAVAANHAARASWIAVSFSLSSLFAFAHLGDLRPGVEPEPAEAAPWLRARLAPFAERPEIADALARLDLQPAAALADLRVALARRRGTPEHAAFVEALFDARLARVDRAVETLVRGMEEHYGDLLVVVAGTRGRLTAGEAALAASELQPEAIETLLLVRGATLPAGTSRTTDVARIVRAFAGGGASLPPDGFDGIAAAAAPGLARVALVAGAWRADVPLGRPEDAVVRPRAGASDASLGDGAEPPSLASGPWRAAAERFAPPSGLALAAGDAPVAARIVSPRGQLAAARAQRGTASVDPGGVVATVSLEAGGRATLLAGERSPALVAELPADAAPPDLPILSPYPPRERWEAPESGEAPWRVDVSRDGAWWDVRLHGEGAGELRARRHPFAWRSLTFRAEGEADDLAWDGVHVVVRGPLPLHLRIELGAGEEPAVTATVEGEPVPPSAVRHSGMRAAEATVRVVLPLLGSWSSGALSLERLDPGPAPDDVELAPDDVAFLQRLLPTE